MTVLTWQDDSTNIHLTVAKEKLISNSEHCAGRKNLMKIYKYWAAEKATVRIGEADKEIKCYGGSNASISEAVDKAKEKIAKVQQKIAGDAHVWDDYEVEIREEIVQVVDQHSIITRNRYGAKVLNVDNLMIMDIDHPKQSFWDLLKKSKDSKSRIVEMVRKLSQKHTSKGCAFRIYETCRGIRVIVLGRQFNPKDSATESMMKDFNCDKLYALLCKKQDCFRARLTPKPGRMKLRGYKVKFPRPRQEEAEFRTWLSGYEAASRNFSVCKLIEQIGYGDITEAVKLHDEISGINWNQTLA